MKNNKWADNPELSIFLNIFLLHNSAAGLAVMFGSAPNLSKLTSS
jgi:hypothetical protein